MLGKRTRNDEIRRSKGKMPPFDLPDLVVLSLTCPLWS
jgi:hypothetical protein